MSYELYQFERGDSEWFYTSGLDSVLFSGDTYTPEVISCSRIPVTTDVYKSSISVSIPIGSGVVIDIINRFSGNECTLRIWRDDLLWWAGRVLGVSIQTNKAVLQCESIYTSVKRLGVRETVERMCRYNLYSTECGVNKDDFSYENMEVTDVNKREITVPGIAVSSDVFKLGLMLKGSEYTTIIKKVGDVFTITKNIGMVAGDNVNIYMGCNHTTTVCHTRFDNVLHFGGFPYIPSSNVFEVGLV